MFTKEQIQSLEAPLDRKHVAQRQQGGAKLSYIEGWHAIAEANRIFGFGLWCRETTSMECVSTEQNAKGNNVVGYLAKVRVMVFADGQPIIREGTGFGSGIAKQLADAHENAAKEAETDAMKRALMTFGNPFGLALYDKTQANVADGWHGPLNLSKLKAAVKALAHDVNIASDMSELDAIKTSGAEVIKQCELDLPQWWHGDPAKEFTGLAEQIFNKEQELNQ